MNGNPLHRLRVVLVEPSHPGNIGAAARAMKAMGLQRLCLVAPERFPSAEATARAAGADDILQAAETRVAVLFGRERSGLTNAEVDKCHALIRIPACAHFSSLNVAAAVQIVSYELRLAAHGRSVATAAPQAPAATAGELEGFYRHLEDTLVRVGYLDPAAPKLLMRRLRRLFSRAEPDRAEINILRGILTAAARASAGASSAAAAPAPGPRQSDDDSAKDASG